MDEESGPRGGGGNNDLSLQGNAEQQTHTHTHTVPALDEVPSHTGINGLATSLPLGDGEDEQQQQQARVADDGRGGAIQPGQHPTEDSAHEQPSAPALLDGDAQGQPFEGLSEQTTGELQSHYPAEQQQEDHLHLQQLLARQSPSAHLSQQHPQMQFQPQTSTQNQQHPVMEPTDGPMQTVISPQQQHEQQQPLPQNLIPHFQNPPPGLEDQQTPPGKRQDGHFANLKMISDPPDLENWREKLFNVEDTIVLSEEE